MTAPALLWRDPWRVMVGAAAACVVAGGLVAAVTGPLDLAHGSWLAAYLVLVGGVAPYVIAWVGRLAKPPAWSGWTVLGCWYAGNALVIAGTLLDRPIGVDAGGVALVVALACSGWGVLRSGAATPIPRWLRAGYLLLLVVLAVSIPIGMVLSHLRR